MSDGTIEQREGRVTCRYERRLAHPVDVVWPMITDPDRIATWTSSRPDIDLQAGGEYVSYHEGGQRVVDRILRVEPPRLFAHTFWEHVNPSAVVTWELTPLDGGCLLVLTHSLGLDDVAHAAATVALGDHPATIIARNAAGWHRLLDMLQARLNNNSAPWSREAQAQLQARYAAQLGEPASGR